MFRNVANVETVKIYAAMLRNKVNVKMTVAAMLRNEANVKMAVAVICYGKSESDGYNYS